MRGEGLGVSSLFTSMNIGGLKLKNRLVMAAMELNWSNPDGSITQRQVDYYIERARGGIG